MDEKEKNGERLSKITILLIIIVAIAMIIILLFKLNVIKLFNLASNIVSEEEGNANNIEEFIKDIEGENNIQIEATGKKINNSKVVNTTYKLDNLEFSKFNISSIDGITKISCVITNTDDLRTVLDGFYLYIYDEDENCMGCQLVEGEKIGARESIEKDIIINGDVANLYQIGLKRVSRESK